MACSSGSRSLSASWPGSRIVQIQLAVGSAEGGPQGIFDDLAVGVQFFFVADLGAHQNFGLPGDLLHRNFAPHLALQRGTNPLYRGLLVKRR